MQVVNHQRRKKLRRGFRRELENFLKRVLKEEKGEGKITVILVDGQYIRDLNRRFLGRDEETDVISFPLDGEGEVYVNIEFAESDEDVVLFSLHGVLHLLGFDHINPLLEGEMRRKEEEYMALWKKFS